MIGVIADDLTGAAELGAVGWRRGLRAHVVCGGVIDGQADLVCMDTDSRSCASDEAAQRAASAAGLFAEKGARWIYKKVDSVLRGNVIAEVEAILKQLHLRLALLAPANPSLGRAVRNGMYLIHGRPLHETEFARDPEHPRHSSEVLALLGSGRDFSVRWGRPTDALPAAGIVVGDAGTAEDLQQWAGRLNAGMLPAGGVEFFGALLTARGCSPAGPRLEHPRGSTSLPGLLICGSTSETAREFVRAASERGTPVFPLPENLASGAEFTPAALEEMVQPVVAALRLHRHVILNIGWPSLRQPSRARLPAMLLVQAAEAVLRQAGVGDIYVEGGATAAELVRRLGWRRLEVLGELALGVTTMATKEVPALRLTIKPGSYSWPDEVRRIFLGLR